MPEKKNRKRHKSNAARYQADVRDEARRNTRVIMAQNVGTWVNQAIKWGCLLSHLARKGSLGADRPGPRW